MIPVLLFLLAGFTAGCAGGGTGATPGTAETTETTEAPETTAVQEETTGETTGMDETLAVEQLAFGTRGRMERGAVVAPSAEVLSAEVGGQVREPIRDAGAGTYLAVFWGEQPTGGYLVRVASARAEGDRVVVVLDLRRPQPGEMVTQALTHPYAVARLPGLDPTNHEFSLETQGGRELGWPVRQTGT